MYDVSSTIVEIPLENKIVDSDMTESEQRQFLNLLSYLTPEEQAELRAIL
jgi:hypothetical protein